MAKVNDIGKVWIRGSVKPISAIRVDKQFFVFEKRNGQLITYWVEEEFLCLDLHDTKKKVRTAKRFFLDSIPTKEGILFSGFEHTKHADVMVVTDDIADTFILEKEDYKSTNACSLNSQVFWQLALSSWK